MKKIISILILMLVLVGGLVFSFTQFKKSPVAHRDIKTEVSKKSKQKPLSAEERKAELKKWEASPDGIQFNQWKSSPAGQKVFSAEAKIMPSIKNFTAMEAVVTSLSLPEGSRLGFGVMVQIEGEDFILSFGIEQPGSNSLNLEKEFDLLRTLKVNDKISLKSKNVSHAPKYAYPIISGDYVERGGEIMYKRTPRKGGC
jgi:cell division protein YceG involved in septum cleavage